MPLDFRGDDNNTDKKASRFGDLSRYADDSYNPAIDDSEPDEVVIPPEIREMAEKSLEVLERAVNAFVAMHASGGREGTREYAAVMKEIIDSRETNLMVITAGITALVHMREAHGEDDD